MCRNSLSIFVLTLTNGILAGPVTAQILGESARNEAVVLHADPAGADADAGPTALDRGRYAVLIDLDENRLYFKQGDLTLWSAPVGTGTGMRLVAEEDAWDFSTPNGRFQVELKEKNPVWIAPDWYFLENNLPVPPPNDPSRFMRETLGAAAVYISPSLAIHGTDRPELIGQRVSHGCIRLDNRYALRLYHNVQVGTEVIIVGGEDVTRNARVVDLREGYDPSLASRTPRRPQPPDPVMERWKEMETSDLAEVLDDELVRSRMSRWDEVAILLLERALDGDERAARALFARAYDLPSLRVELEWATFLTELYRASPQRTLEVMSRLAPLQREATADLIVLASLTLYRGDYDDPGVPWPSRRLPASQVPRLAQPGWEALLAAEARQRERHREMSTKQNLDRYGLDEASRGGRVEPIRFSF